jgi:hypothetical protein
MSNVILTAKTALATPAVGDVLYIIDVSDTTDNAAGSSRKITVANLSGGGLLIGETSTSTLTNKTIDLTDNTLTGTLAEFNTALSDNNFASLTGTETLSGKTLISPIITTPAMGANSIDAITEIAAALKSGSDATLITGTEGTSGDLAQWNADGDLVDGPTPPSGTILGTTDTQTLTNKRITKRVTTITSHATPTVNTDNCDCVTITALGEAITSMTTNLSGTPTNFQTLIYRILDDGTARAITWGASFQAMGITLPTTTVASKVLTVGFIYDSVDEKWGCVASAYEA